MLGIEPRHSGKPTSTLNTEPSLQPISDLSSDRGKGLKRPECVICLISSSGHFRTCEPAGGCKISKMKFLFFFSLSLLPPLSFFEAVSYSPGWLQVQYVFESDLELFNPPAPISQALGL